MLDKRYVAVHSHRRTAFTISMNTWLQGTTLQVPTLFPLVANTLQGSRVTPRAYWCLVSPCIHTVYGKINTSTPKLDRAEARRHETRRIQRRNLTAMRIKPNIITKWRSWKRNQTIRGRSQARLRAVSYSITSTNQSDREATREEECELVFIIRCGES